MNNFAFPFLTIHSLFITLFLYPYEENGRRYGCGILRSLRYGVTWCTQCVQRSSWGVQGTSESQVASQEKWMCVVNMLFGVDDICICSFSSSNSASYTICMNLGGEHWSSKSLLYDSFSCLCKGIYRSLHF